MKNDFVSSGRSVSDMKAHLVLTTKYRRKAFTGEMLKRLEEVLVDLCQKWNCKLSVLRQYIESQNTPD
jgi:putative transposase